MSIRIDINLRWLAPITILQACHELAHVITARGLKVPSLSFAVDEHGPYHQARSIDELYQSHPLITTGGGVIHDSTGADWATFSVDTPCEPTKAGFTVKIRVRISRQLTAGQYLPTEIMDFAQLALKLTSADVVYGLNVGKYKGCFDHPTPSNREVLFWLPRIGVVKLPQVSACETATSHDKNHYRFVNSSGQEISRDQFAAAENQRLTNRCQIR